MLLGALLLAPLAGGAAPSAPVMQERRARWYADLEEGQRAARRAGKHVLVDFSGAGWSEPSRNFERAILGRAASSTRGRADAPTLRRVGVRRAAYARCSR